MSRFLAWFGWVWRDHAKLVIGCALACVFVTWIALLIGRWYAGGAALESMLVGELAVVAIVLAVGLFNSERRHGAEALLLRTPGARVPLFLARLAFFATALAGVAIVASFGAARLTALEQGAYTVVPWFVWPRYIVADALVLAVAFGAVGALVSAWTQRVALAFVLGLVLPAVLLFPWIYLGAARHDFFPFSRLGAIPIAAWPLLGLALAALGVSWFVGRRWLNRPRRAVLAGSLVLLVGMGIAGLWTAQAFAAFDDVRADAPGFRMETSTIEFSGSVRATYGFLPLESVALSPDGRVLWVQGFRHDAGRWPNPRDGSHGPHARDFRENRGTWSRQWRIDLETGEASSVGDVRERILWQDLGSGQFHGLLRGVDWQARLAPRAFALFGRPGHADEAQLVDLANGTLVACRQGAWSSTEPASLVRQVAASGTGVRDAEGRPAWLEMERVVNAKGETLGGNPDVFIATPAGRTAVDDDLVRALSNMYAATWQAIPGGWGRISGTPRFVTLEAATGRVRKASEAQSRRASSGAYTGTFFLDTRHVLTAIDAGRGSNEDVRYALFDLETGGVGPDLVGPASPYIALTPTPDGRLLCLEKTETGRRFMLWSPRTDEKVVLGLDGNDEPLSADTFFTLQGADLRGNMVLSVAVGPQQPGVHTQRTVLFHAATAQVLTIDQPKSALEGPAFHAVGIDDQDRVIGLAGHDGNGFRTVERFDPADASRVVLFPKDR